MGDELLNRALPVGGQSAAVHATYSPPMGGNQPQDETCGFAKRLIYEVPEMEQQEAFAWAADLSGRLFRGEEAAAGMKAFLKREKPPWAADGETGPQD